MRIWTKNKSEQEGGKMQKDRRNNKYGFTAL